MSTPNDDQRRAVESPATFLRVSGPPGTGKTLVLLWRAQRLAAEARAKGSSGQVLVFCYNKTLAKYAHDLLRLNGAPSTIQTITFHKWAYRQLDLHGERPNVIEDDDRRELIRQVLADCAHDAVHSPLLRRPVDWWQDEIEWIKGQAIDTWEVYKDVERTGRGAGLREPARQVVWRVYTGYEAAMQEQGAMDFRDFSLRLHALWSKLPARPRIAHVLVDEAQDLRFADLRILKRLARDSFTAVADRRQKIYRTSFAWKDLEEGDTFTGIVLKLMYRNTRPVAALAACLHRKDPLVRPGDFDYGSTELPDKEGPLPVLLAVANAHEEEAMVLRLVAHLSQVHGGRPIGVLARQWVTVKQAEKAFVREHIPYEIIKDQSGNAVTHGVKLTTFHSAKGLEFADVIIIGLTEGLFPPPVGSEVATEEGESDEDFLGTERRLLYVAMTRTRRGLYLLHRPPPSRFLAELDPSLYATTVPGLEQTEAPEMAPTGAVRYGCSADYDDIPF